MQYHLKSTIHKYSLLLKLFILFIAIGAGQSARAQFGPMPGGASGISGTISGTVIDSVTKKPLDYATVSIYRSGGKSPLNGTLTDGKGNFKLPNVKTGSYTLQVAFIGYPTKTILNVETTPGKPDKNLGTIIVAPGAKMLQAVQVTGQKALIENHIDKLVFNAEKDVTSTGGNISDVLRKVPMVSVDMDGNVSLRGNQNVRILINGKPSGALATNAADVLKSMPADQVKNIEVITSPSAKYDAEGSAGIINIVTKKKDISGVSGSVSGGIGTRQNNENVNLNINKNRLSLTGNFGYNTGWPQTTYTTFTSQNSALGTSSSSNGSSTSNRHFEMGSASLGYDFNSYNSLSSSFSLRGGGFENNGSTYNSNTSPQSGTINYTAYTNSKTSMSNFDWNTDFTHKFKKEGEELSIAGQWSHGIADVNYLSEYTGFTRNQRAINNGTNNEYTLQADYVLPFSKMFKLETGAKSIFRKISSEYDYYNLDNSGTYILNTATSNNYDYNQDVYAGYGLLTATLNHGITLQGGARMETTDINGNSGNTSTGLASFKNTYHNFIPSLAISKALTPTQTLKLSYSKRIQRPSLQYLNPFLNTSDPLNQSQGNPELSPEVTQTLELNYSTFIKTSVINASVYYRRTNNIIESYVSTKPYTTVDNNGNSETRDVSITNYLNVGNNNSIGANLFGSVELFKVFTARGSVDVFTYKPEITSNLQTQANQSTYINYHAFISGSVKITKTLAAETFMIQNSPRRTFQGTNPAFSLWVIGIKQELWKKRGSIGLNVTQPFNDYKNFTSRINSGPLTQYSQFSVPFRSFGLSFTYNFGKMNFGGQMPEKKKGVNNDDLKQGDSNGMGQGSGPGK